MHGTGIRAIAPFGAKKVIGNIDDDCFCSCIHIQQPGG